MNIYEILNKLNINYEEEKHEKLYTVEEANNASIHLDGIGCKNLFLTDNKDHYYLVVMEDNKRCDLKKLSKDLGIKKISFASEVALNSILKLEKGSVTPLGIVNDFDCLVKVIIDKELIEKKLLVHPNRNDRTINIKYCDLISLIEYANHDYILLDI